MAYKRLKPVEKLTTLPAKDTSNLSGYRPLGERDDFFCHSLGSRDGQL
jgi:hypothetical protein